MACSNVGTAESTLACLLLALLAGPSALAEELVLVSGDWHPYVDSRRNTEAEQVVGNLLMLDGDTVRWSYPGFYFATERLRAGTADAGFPYFATPARRREFLFSEAVFDVDNVVIYNRRHNELGDAPADLSDRYWRDRRIGAVGGYSYEGLAGFDPDGAVSYGSERRALAALLRGDVDILPIERSVWRSLMLRYFPDQFYLIRELPGAEWSTGIHLMMPRSEPNQQRLARFNERLAQFRASNPDVDFTFPVSEIASDVGRGTASLESTQLLPLVLGYDGPDPGLEPSIVIPEGTAVIVTDWDDGYFRYRSGIPVITLLRGLSRVLIVNGPHVGQQVYVQNAHIRVR